MLRATIAVAEALRLQYIQPHRHRIFALQLDVSRSLIPPKIRRRLRKLFPGIWKHRAHFSICSYLDRPMLALVPWNLCWADLPCHATSSSSNQISEAQMKMQLLPYLSSLLYLTSLRPRTKSPSNGTDRQISPWHPRIPAQTCMK